MMREIVRKCLWIVGSVLFLLVLCTGVGLYVHEQFQPPAGERQEVILEIEPGSSSARIASQLEEARLIRSAFFYRFYLNKEGYATHLKAGTYQFYRGETIAEITRRMVAGEVYRDTVTFTIPEGLTVEQIALRLQEKGLADAKTFITLSQEGDFSDFDFVRKIPKQDSLKYRLEGYLFPSTYEVERGSREEMLIRRMLQQTAALLTEERMAQLKARQMTVHEWLTLGSLVEREAAVAKERPAIAGVLWNRLEAGWPLQVDATVQYILDEPKERLTHTDLDIDDPYNTYRYEGLPPGPIGSPGRAALEAVLKPKEHDYFFYVTKKDGSREHYFARTYEEHRANIALSEAERQERQPLDEM